jgi:hypothetical protein
MVRLLLSKHKRFAWGVSQHGRIDKTVFAIALLLFLVSNPVMGKEASDADRKGMSVEIATYIYNPYHDERHPNAFGGSTRIEIGAADIEESPHGRYALADWRSADGKRWGQVGFLYACDHWSIGPITVDRHMTQRELAAWGQEKTATKLIAGLDQLEQQHIAFVPPSQPTNGC